MTIAIVPSDDGSLLTLTHEAVNADLARRTEAGWSMILDGFAAALG